MAGSYTHALVGLCLTNFRKLVTTVCDMQNERRTRNAVEIVHCKKARDRRSSMHFEQTL